MERQAFNSLNEAALQVQLGESSREPKSDAIWSRKHNGFVSPKDFKKDIKDTHDKMKKHYPENLCMYQNMLLDLISLNQIPRLHLKQLHQQHY